MTRPTGAWVWPIATLLIATLPIATLLIAALLAAAAPAGDDSDRHVRRRIAAMYQAQAALDGDSFETPGMRPPGWARMRPPWGGRAHAGPQATRRR